MDLSRNKKVIISIVLIVIAALSATMLTNYFSTPEAYEKQIAQIDKTSENVLIMVGIATAASAAITLLPDDFGTPIAEKLTDISEDLTIVLFAVYLEKYLMILSGWVAFRLLFPAGCLLWIIGMVSKRGWFNSLALKLAILGIAMVLIVPSSLFLSQKINEVCDYEETIEAAMGEGENFTLGDEENVEDTEAVKADEDVEESGEKGVLDTIIGAAKNLKDKTKETVKDAADTISGVAQKIADLTPEKVLASVKSALNHLIEATIVLLVTSCGIPILVLLFYVLLIKWIFNVDIDTRSLMKRPSKRIKEMELLDE